MPRISIIGSYTGRNAGDAAILENVVRDIVQVCPEAQFEVPTISPRFVRETYPDLPLDPVATLPWNLSIKTFGLPLIRSVLRSDAIIVTSAILFDRQFWNPLYNYLSSLLLGLPLAKRLGKKVFFYSVGVGPVYTAKGRAIVRYLIDHSDGITLREEASIGIMKELGIQAEPVLAADPALNQGISPDVQVEIQSLIESAIGPGPWAAVNLNAYVDDWTGRKGEGTLGRKRFCDEMAKVVQTLTEDWGWGVVLICTHHMDEAIMKTVMEAGGHGRKTLLMLNRQYDHRQLMAAMAACEFMIGMRLHCQILAVAANTPCVALNYAPKVRHFMQMAGLEDLTIDFDVFSAERVLERSAHLRDHLTEIRAELAVRVSALKKRAKISPRLLRDVLAG